MDEDMESMGPWLAENSVIDSDLMLLAKKGFVSKVTISETDKGGYYVTMRVKPHKETIHLATRRNRAAPRVFMNLGRLITHIRAKIKPLTEVKLNLQAVLERRAGSNGTPRAGKERRKLRKRF